MKNWSMVVWMIIMVSDITGEARALPWTRTGMIDPAREIVLNGMETSSSSTDHLRNDSIDLFEDIVINTRLELMLPDVANDRGTFISQETQPDLVPEPATVLLLGIGLLGFAVFSRKKAVR